MNCILEVVRGRHGARGQGGGAVRTLLSPSLAAWQHLTRTRGNREGSTDGLIGKLQQHFIILLLLSVCYMASLSSDKRVMDTKAPSAKRQKTETNGNGYGFDVGVNYSEGSVS